MSLVGVVFFRKRPLRRADHLSRGVLPSVVCPLNAIAKPHKRKSLPRIESKRHKKKSLNTLWGNFVLRSIQKTAILCAQIVLHSNIKPDGRLRNHCAFKCQACLMAVGVSHANV